MKKGLEQGIVIRLVLMLVFLAAIIGLVRVIKGQAEGGVSQLNNLLGDLSPCENLRTVDFDTFLESVERVYGKCEADRNDCKYAGCEEMTLSTGGASCYKINKTVLTAHGLGHFVSEPWPAPTVPNIDCCVSHVFGFSLFPGVSSEELDIYNPKDCDAFGRGFQRCTPTDFFSITDGSRITITAEQSGASNVAGADVIIKISGGGTDYSACVAPP